MAWRRQTECDGKRCGPLQEGLPGHQDRTSGVRVGVAGGQPWWRGGRQSGCSTAAHATGLCGPWAALWVSLA